MQSAAQTQVQIDSEYVKCLYRIIFKKALLLKKQNSSDILLDRYQTRELFENTEKDLKKDLQKFFIKKTDLSIFLFDSEPFATHFLRLFQGLHTNPEVLFALTGLWLNNFDEVEDIAAECTYIETQIKETRFSPFCKHIHKIGAIQILEREIETRNLKSNDAIRHFLSIHRNSFLFGGFGNTTSYTIYEYIKQSNFVTAESQLEKVKIAYEKELELAIESYGNLWRNSLKTIYKG